MEFFNWLFKLEIFNYFSHNTGISIDIILEIGIDILGVRF